MLAGAFWTLIERFGEAFVAFREELVAPGEANFEDVRGVWDI